MVERFLERTCEYQVEAEILQAGTIAHYHDGEGTGHMAIVLEVEGRQTFALFLTSRPGWNPFARQATREELALLGIPVRKVTYLAPVLRATNCFVPTTKPNFSAERISDLLREFPRSKALPDVGY